MNKEKIQEQFHYFNIHDGIDSVYGNCAVSTEGNVVYSVFSYAILAIHMKDADWMGKMNIKVGFRPECEDSIRKTIIRAKEIRYNLL